MKSANRESVRFLAYKLLEWSGDCKCRADFDKLSEPMKRNALVEAESILAELAVPEAHELLDPAIVNVVCEALKGLMTIAPDYTKQYDRAVAALAKVEGGEG